jgi:hypothetical protein
MDNGEVIPALNEPWTLAGAKLSEWGSGVVMFLLLPEITGMNPTKNMPIFLLVMVGTVFGMAALRNCFPDEERGLANYTLTKLGFNPPLIPAPSALQPYWSGAPLHELAAKKEFVTLGLQVAIFDEQEQEAEEEVRR